MYNIFLAMWLDVVKLLYLSSDLEDYGFGDICVFKRELSAAEFETLVERGVCHVNEMFGGKLLPS